MPATRPEWYIIVNPLAGSGKTMSEWVPAEKTLKELKVPYKLVYTTHKRHAEELAAVAARMGFRRILAVGGDGSVHEVFQGILHWCDDEGIDPSEFYVGVMPIGSGNDWLRSLGIPNNVNEVCRIMARESFGTQDIIKATVENGEVHYMANCGGVGFDSHVCERANWQKSRGKRKRMIYVKALRYTLFHLRPMFAQVICDGKPFYTGKLYSIAMGVGRYSGGGLCQVPKARMDDGLLDIMVVPKVPIRKIVGELPRLLNKTVHESPIILYNQCSKLSLLPLDSMSHDIMELDGEIVGKMPLDVEVTGRHINVLKY